MSTAVSVKPVLVIVEDDRDLNNLLRYNLECQEEFEVVSCFQGSAGLEAIRNRKPALVLLDVMLPDISGIEILRLVRRDASVAHIPIVCLTARTREEEVVEGLEAGADDYIAKPFSPRELILRIKAILRRSVGPLPSVGARSPALEIGPLRILPQEFRVLVAGEPVAVTMTEFRLLLFLAERAGKLVPREILLQEVWGYRENFDSRTVDTHLKRLRRKLGACGDLVRTVHGFGYQLVPPGAMMERD